MLTSSTDFLRPLFTSSHVLLRVCTPLLSSYLTPFSPISCLLLSPRGDWSTTSSLKPRLECKPRLLPSISSYCSALAAAALRSFSVCQVTLLLLPSSPVRERFLSALESSLYPTLLASSLASSLYVTLLPPSSL